MTQPKANKHDELLRGVFGPSLDDYKSNPSRYVQRVHPERMNWGPHMDTEALTKAGLSANRVPVIGDWDYAEVCVQAADVWTVSEGA